MNQISPFAALLIFMLGAMYELLLVVAWSPNKKLLVLANIILVPIAGYLFVPLALTVMRL